MNPLSSLIQEFRELEIQGLVETEIIVHFEKKGANLSEIFKVVDIIHEQGPIKTEK